jgi:hypothetical protein
MIAEELLLMTPAVAEKIPVVEPLMLTLAGTGSSALLLARLTVAVPVGTPLNVTVQVVVCAGPSAPGEQLTEDNCTGATRLNQTVVDPPPPLATITAV